MVGNYFLGLDIGSDSIGFAATDERYKLIKFKGEPVWGSHLFDPAEQSAQRRAFRTARRRLDRRQHRVTLVDELLSEEIAKVDKNYFVRKKESSLWYEDKSVKEKYLFFVDDEYTDKSFHNDYPTIHHLIYDLIVNKQKKFDIRLIEIALSWLVAHRGHFLSDIKVENSDKLIDISILYNEFMEYFEYNDIQRPWGEVDPVEFGNIIKLKGINNKKQKLKEYLYQNNIPKDSEEDIISKKELVNFIAGGKVACSKLFRNSDFEEDLKISISDDMEEVLPKLGDYADLVALLAKLYDWSILSDILKDSKYISEAKVKIYETHKKDLKDLKRIVRKYFPDKYNKVFKDADKNLDNYVAYSYNLRSVNGKIEIKKVSKESFCDFLKKQLKFDSIEFDDKDKDLICEMSERINNYTFMPKQVDKDNRVIPYQLYCVEYNRIIDDASVHYDFLNEKDEQGVSVADKLKSVFTFKVPYFVGPLRTDNTSNGWMCRAKEGKIYPWNFDTMVDFDKSEMAFIKRMTNNCTYLPESPVLPKHSLLYQKFTVLNEINNIKVNGLPISIDVKKKIYTELFERSAKVSVKRITEFLHSEGIIQKQDTISGIDSTIKSSLKTLYDFRRLLSEKSLSTKDIEDIVEHCTYTEDKSRYKRWLKQKYSYLSPDDIRYISGLKYKDFGRLSKRFLCELKGKNKKTGEIGTIIDFLWNSNDNLMVLLSDEYTFKEEIEKINEEYYKNNPKSISEQIEDMGLSGGVKRPVIRALDVVKDITSSLRKEPSKIFVEMARGEDAVKERKLSRYEQIKALYAKIPEDTFELSMQLEQMGAMVNNRLQSEALYLYYMQLGKSMYSGKPIDISLIGTSVYNVDHIYPQSMVKDDSVLNNKVLVLSTENADKGDKYPIDANVRHKMADYWYYLLKNELITKEKYERLIRSRQFTEEEKLGFINRQLVETRQSMKAVTQLLNRL